MANKVIHYTLRALSYNKNMNALNDWVNPSIIEKNFKTKLEISFDTLKTNDNCSYYEVSINDKSLNKQKKGKIPFLINKKFYNNSSLYLKDIAYNDLICEQIADYFNIFLEEKLPYLKQFIKFERHILYEIDNDKVNNFANKDFFYNYKYIISEESLPIELKLTTIPSGRTFQSFSHFSYQITGGQLLISNFKYNRDIKKIIKYQISFLRDNGYKNILEFFSSHICDNTCKVFGLIHPRKKINPIQIDDKFYSKKYLTYINLCNCCSAPIHINEDDNNLYCGFCSYNEPLTKIKAICSECHFPFYYSTFIFNSKLINYPKKCAKCIDKF